MDVKYDKLLDSKVEQLLGRVQGGELTPSAARFELTIYSEAIKDVIFGAFTREYADGYSKGLIKYTFLIFDEAVRLMEYISFTDIKFYMSMAEKKVQA